MYNSDIILVLILFILKTIDGSASDAVVYFSSFCRNGLVREIQSDV